MCSWEGRGDEPEELGEIMAGAVHNSAKGINPSIQLWAQASSRMNT
jgi:hypothetical protein